MIMTIKKLDPQTEKEEHLIVDYSDQVQPQEMFI